MPKRKTATVDTNKETPRRSSRQTNTKKLQEESVTDESPPPIKKTKKSKANGKETDIVKSEDVEKVHDDKEAVRYSFS